MGGILIFLWLLFYLRYGQGLGCPADWNCLALATCNAGTCECDAGYSGNGIAPGGSCTNINECDIVGVNEVCVLSDTVCVDVNPPVGLELYNCLCAPGFIATGDPEFFPCSPDTSCGCPGPTCSGAGPPVCGPNAQCNADPFGVYVCPCNSGYEGDGFIECTDIDDCDPNPCGDFSTCVDNIDTDPTCGCIPGYEDEFDSTGLDIDCQNIDECLDGVCTGANTHCVDTDGGYYCQCDDGWDGDASSSTGCTTDDLECTNGDHNCGANEQCCEKLGGFTCQCGGSCGDSSPTLCADTPGTYCSADLLCVVPPPAGFGDECTCHADCLDEITESGGSLFGQDLDLSCINAYCAWSPAQAPSNYQCFFEYLPSLATCCPDADSLDCTVDHCDGNGHCIPTPDSNLCSPAACQSAQCVLPDGLGGDDDCVYTDTCPGGSGDCGENGTCDTGTGECGFDDTGGCPADPDCGSYTCTNTECQLSTGGSCPGGDTCNTVTCNIDGSCSSQANTGVPCDPGPGECLTGTCNSAGICVSSPDISLCSQGLACQQPTCTAGVCGLANTGVCLDGWECTTGVCNPLHTDEGGALDADPNTGCWFDEHDDQCALGISCVTGICDPHGLRVCLPDVFDVNTGSCNVENFPPDAFGCRFPTSDDFCNDDTVGTGGGDQLECTLGSCDPDATECFSANGCVQTPIHAQCDNVQFGNACTTGVCTPKIPGGVDSLREADGCYYEPRDDACGVASLCGVAECSQEDGCLYHPQDDWCDVAHDPNDIDNVCKVFECNPVGEGGEDGDGCEETNLDGGCLCSTVSDLQTTFEGVLGCPGPAGHSAVCDGNGNCVCNTLMPTPAPVDPTSCLSCTDVTKCQEFCACERDANFGIFGSPSTTTLGALCQCNHLHPDVYENCDDAGGQPKEVLATCYCDSRDDCGSLDNCNPISWTDTCAAYGQCCCQCNFGLLSGGFDINELCGSTDPDPLAAHSAFGNDISDDGDGDVWNWQQANAINNGYDVNKEPKEHNNHFYNDYNNDNDGNVKSIEYNIKLSPQMMAIVGGLLLLLVGNIIYCKIKKSNIKRNALYNENQKEQEQNV